MRCKDVQKIVLGFEVPAEVESHLASCPVCAAYWRDCRLVRSGLRLVAEDPVPEPTLGFAQRLVRQLEGLRQVTWPRENFWELAGRRTVYATLFLTLVVILALVLPSRGPWRRQAGVSDIYPAEPVVMAVETDPVLSGESTSTLPASPANAPAEGEGGQK